MPAEAYAALADLAMWPPPATVSCHKNPYREVNSSRTADPSTADPATGDDFARAMRRSASTTQSRVPGMNGIVNLSPACLRKPSMTILLAFAMRWAE